MRRLPFLLLVLLAAPWGQARDLSAFNILRLEMPDAGAFVAPRERWAIDTQVGYQNTWAMSPNIQDYFETRNARRRLDAADIAAIRALPFEKFLVDLEMAVVDVSVHRRLTDRWSAFATLGLVSYDGGFMDGPIERFHSALGFREYVRTAVPRNRFTVLTELKDSHSLVQSAPSGGLLDPVLGLRYRDGTLVVDGAVKVPVQGTRRFVSTGKADFGLQATLRGARGPHSGFVSVSGVSSGGGGIVEAHRRQFVPALTAGYEYALGQGTSAFAQGHATRYALDSSDTDIGGLRQAKVQATLGMRHRTGRSTVSLALIEGFGAYNGLPDLGLQLGWTLDLLH